MRRLNGQTFGPHAEKGAAMIFDKEMIVTQLTPRIAAAWKRADTTFPSLYASVSPKKQHENEVWIEKSGNQLKSCLQSYPTIATSKKKAQWKQTMLRTLDDLLISESILGISDVMSHETFQAFQDQMKSMLRMIRSFDPDLSLQDIGQAFRNYLVYAVFRELNGLPQRCTPAIFGYSMLYPYTDNYLDCPDHSPEEKAHYNRMIYKKLKGTPYSCSSEHESKTADLLSSIESVYSRDADSEAFSGLLLMLEAQENSQNQTEHSSLLTTDEILKISIYKGGLSVLLDRFFIDHPITEQDLYFYYGFGFMLQLCDDIQDIGQDRESGSHTLLSRRSPQEAAETVNKLLHFTNTLFASCATPSPAFRDFLLHSCFQLVLTSAVGSGAYFPEAYLESLEPYLSVSLPWLNDLLAKTSKGEMPALSPQYMQILDTFLED